MHLLKRMFRNIETKQKLAIFDAFVLFLLQNLNKEKYQHRRID